MNIICKNIDVCNILELSSSKFRSCTFVVSLSDFIKRLTGSYATNESEEVLKTWIETVWIQRYARSKAVVSKSDSKYRTEIRLKWLQNVVADIPKLQKKHIGKQKMFTLPNIEDASERTKRELLSDVEKEISELLPKMPSDSMAKLLGFLSARVAHKTEKSRPLAKRMRLSLGDDHRKITDTVYTEDEACALYIGQLDCSQREYQAIRNSYLRKKMPRVIPTYRKILTAKRRCLPETVTDKASYSVKLENLVVQTVERIAEAHGFEIQEGTIICLLGGCDGMSYSAIEIGFL